MYSKYSRFEEVSPKEYNILLDNKDELSELFKEELDLNIRSKLRNLNNALSINWNNAHWGEVDFLIDPDKKSLITHNSDVNLSKFKVTNLKKCPVSKLSHNHYEKGQDIDESVFDGSSLPNIIGDKILSYVEQKKYCIFSDFIHEENIKKYATKHYFDYWLKELKEDKKLSLEIIKALNVITNIIFVQSSMLLEFLNDIESNNI